MAPELLEQHRMTVLDAETFAPVAQALVQENQKDAQRAAQQIAQHLESLPGDVIMSCPDLAGDPPGQTARRRIYPKLVQNIKQLTQALPNFDCRFCLSAPDPDDWLRDCFERHLETGTRFGSLDGFRKFYQVDTVWAGVEKRLSERLGDAVAWLPASGPNTPAAPFLDEVLGSDGVALAEKHPVEPAAAPDEQTVHLWAAINGSSASKAAKIAAKSAMLDKTAPADAKRPEPRKWPPTVATPNWLDPDLKPLWSRTGRRVNAQTQPNLLPPGTADLTAYRTRIIEAGDGFPEGGRGQMENQINILSYRFRGLPELCLLLGLSISYLRRATDHTAEAAHLFQRLWAEEHAMLLGVLPTRWLISTFQTFMDHGANETQRLIGASAYFMTNTIKLYEAERAIEGLAPDAVYPGTKPQTKSGFRGLDRFPVGGSDLMLNTNALLLELAGRDPVAGRVVQEFLLRMKTANTAFTRMDLNRAHHGAHHLQFENCWSFFEPPDQS